MAVVRGEGTPPKITVTGTVHCHGDCTFECDLSAQSLVGEGYIVSEFVEVPELVRAASPVYVKLGLRNAPDLYPAGQQLQAAAVAKGKGPMSQAPLASPEQALPPTIVESTPAYKKAKILERITEPERAVSFRVSWMDDRGEIQVNRGFRIEMNSAIGPYKGGLRFHPSVNLGILKFLAFEQVFKNSLTTLSLAAAAGTARPWRPQG